MDLGGRNLLPKVVKKFQRIKLSDSIRAFIQSLPVKGIKETQIGNHVYSGYGQIGWGTSYIPVLINIEMNKDGMFTHIKTAKTGSIICPFNTEQEQELAPVQVKKILERGWN